MLIVKNLQTDLGQRRKVLPALIAIFKCKNCAGSRDAARPNRALELSSHSQRGEVSRVDRGRVPGNPSNAVRT